MQHLFISLIFNFMFVSSSIAVTDGDCFCEFISDRQSGNVRASVFSKGKLKPISKFSESKYIDVTKSCRAHLDSISNGSCKGKNFSIRNLNETELCEFDFLNRCKQQIVNASQNFVEKIDSQLKIYDILERNRCEKSGTRNKVKVMLHNTDWMLQVTAEPESCKVISISILEIE